MNHRPRLRASTVIGASSMVCLSAARVTGNGPTIPKWERALKRRGRLRVARKRPLQHARPRLMLGSGPKIQIRTLPLLGFLSQIPDLSFM